MGETIDMSEPFGLAKKIPKPRMCKDWQANNAAQMQYEALCKINMWLEMNPTKIIHTWNLLSSSVGSSSSSSKPESDQPFWNAEYRQIWRLPNYWCASFLQTRRPDVFTKSYLDQLERQDTTNIPKLFRMEVGLELKDPLPSVCLNKEVCSATMVARAVMLGNRLSQILADRFPSNGKLDWHALGRYVLEFGADGKLSSVKHKSGVVGTVPEFYVITVDFKLIDNHSDMEARVEYILNGQPLIYKLTTFFEVGSGPHTSDIGPKGEVFKLFAEEEKKKLDNERLQLQAKNIVSDTTLLAEGKMELRKRALELARQKVRESKKRRIESQKVSFK